MQEASRLVPLWKIACFVCFDTTMMASMTFLTTILMPVQVMQLVGDADKELLLGVMVAIAGI